MEINYEYYKEVVKYNLSLDTKSWNFKHNPYYTPILEHVSPEEGFRYMECLEKEFREVFISNFQYIYDTIKENDSYGQPNTVKYTEEIECSPTNFRYIYHSFLILAHMKEKCVNMVEIGGGYGGLCLYLYKLAPLFNIEIQSYTIFDIEHVIDLQKKYLTQFNISINTYTLDSNYTIKDNSFLISNYAFSEISDSLQKTYIQKVISKCNHGFLVWNHINLYEFTHHTIHSEIERPTTSKTDHKNLFVYF